MLPISNELFAVGLQIVEAVPVELRAQYRGEWLRVRARIGAFVVMQDAVVAVLRRGLGHVDAGFSCADFSGSQVLAGLGMTASALYLLRVLAAV